MISHNVYFELKDASEEKINLMIADCHKWLKPIEGIVHFAAGRMLESHNREVNVRDYHVGTHIIFTNKAAHDNYQICDLHNSFIEAHKDNWKSVRVFDWAPDYLM